MKNVFLRLCISLFFATAYSAIGQEGTRKVDFLEINDTLDSKRFDPIWKRLLEQLVQEDLSEGRMVASEFPVAQIEIFAQERISSDTPPSSLLVCDFSNDFVELRYRKDWYKPSLPKTSSKESGSAGKALVPFNAKLANEAKVMPSSVPLLKTIPLFQLEKADNYTLLSKNIYRLDMSARYTTGQGTYVKLPMRNDGTWPCQFDKRLLGWCRLGQILLPTTSEDWVRILKTFEAYSIHMAEADQFRLTCVERDSKRVAKKYWLFDVELHQNEGVRPRAITAYAVYSEENQILRCKTVPEFMSRFFYSGDSLKTVVFVDSQKATGRRFDLEVVAGDFPNEEHFDVLTLSGVEAIRFDPSINQVLRDSIETSWIDPAK